MNVKHLFAEGLEFTKNKLLAAKDDPLFVVFALITVVYIFFVMRIRFEGITAPYVADGDHHQAVAHYWRYHISGAMPPGNLLTDYAFVMHAPPFWWLPMAFLSMFFEPATSAIILNLIAFVATCLAAYACIRHFASPLVSLAGPLLIAHSPIFHLLTAGGYARSFGPFLTLLFLAVWMREKHKTTLAVLVLQAGLYPSVVMPCGIAYGIWCLLKGEGRARVMRTLTVIATGGAVVALGLFQSMAAPGWWGSVVWKSEAALMPSWRAGGRVSEFPLKPPAKEIARQLTSAFRPLGEVLSQKLTRITQDEYALAHLVIITLLLVYLAMRKKRLPLKAFGLMGGSLMAYFLARTLAYKLYLPFRTLQHVLPWVTYVIMGACAFDAMRTLLPNHKRLVQVLALVLAIGPMFAFSGTGLGKSGRKTYQTSFARSANLYEFIKELPLDATFAGSFGILDDIPLFAHHQVYVNRVLAHPFRQGYFKEIKRRIIENYSALYAASPCEIVERAQKEKLDYMVFAPKDAFRRFDSRLFEPVAKPLRRVFKENKRRGFYLAKPDPSSVIYSEGRWRIVDLKALAKAHKDSCTF